MWDLNSHLNANNLKKIETKYFLIWDENKNERELRRKRTQDA